MVGRTDALFPFPSEQIEPYTESLESFLVGHKVDLYNTATETARSGRIVRYDPRKDKHLIAFDPEEEEEKEGEGEEGKEAAAAKAPERKWVTLRVRFAWSRRRMDGMMDGMMNVNGIRSSALSPLSISHHRRSRRACRLTRCGRASRGHRGGRARSSATRPSSWPTPSTRPCALVVGLSVCCCVPFSEAAGWLTLTLPFFPFAP